MEETIAAISTPLGTGGLAVIRVSGKGALALGDQVFRGSSRPTTWETYTVHYGVIHDGLDRIDEVLVSIFRAPHSYTAEDMIEISCHGGTMSAQRILQVLLEKGARLAQPGEFTRRAFLNGRIDLTQAEAVMDLVSAQTRGAHAAALLQLQGHLLQKIEKLYTELSASLAHVEAHTDFPEEDIAPNTREGILAEIQAAAAHVEALLRTAREGRILREGVRVVIVGKPNVGKSSLLNHLLGEERAIVSATPGTTRDSIEEIVNIEGIPLRIVDTAGLRESAEEVEKEGMARTRRNLEAAELVLLMFDCSRRMETIDRELLATCRQKPLIVILNKKDLGQAVDAHFLRDLTTCAVSVKTGEGMDHLRKTIAIHLWQGKAPGSGRESYINARHQESLLRARAALDKTKAALQAKRSFEYVAADLREALDALGEVSGRTAKEDVLDRIFSSFCIGK